MDEEYLKFSRGIKPPHTLTVSSIRFTLLQSSSFSEAPPSLLITKQGQADDHPTDSSCAGKASLSSPSSMIYHL